MLITFSITLGTLFSYRRGLRSCLSLQGGKFEGQEREISDKHESHAFFILKLVQMPDLVDTVITILSSHIIIIGKIRKASNRVGANNKINEVIC